MELRETVGDPLANPAQIKPPSVGLPDSGRAPISSDITPEAVPLAAPAPAVAVQPAPVAAVQPTEKELIASLGGIVEEAPYSGEEELIASLGGIVDEVQPEPVNPLLELGAVPAEEPPSAPVIQSESEKYDPEKYKEKLWGFKVFSNPDFARTARSLADEATRLPTWFDGEPREAEAGRIKAVSEWKAKKDSAPLEVQAHVERALLKNKLTQLEEMSFLGGLSEQQREIATDIRERLGMDDSSLERRFLSGRAGGITSASDIYRYGAYTTHKAQQAATLFNAGNLKEAQDIFNRLDVMEEAAAAQLPQYDNFFGKMAVGTLESLAPMAESMVIGAFTGGMADKLYWQAQGQGEILRAWLKDSGKTLQELTPEEINRARAISAVAGAAYAAIEYLGDMFGLQGAQPAKQQSKIFFGKFVREAVASDSFTQKALRGGAKFVWQWFNETQEEGWQQMVSSIGSDAIDGDVDLLSALKEGGQAFVESIPATLGLVGLGGAVSKTVSRQQERKALRQAIEQAKQSAGYQDLLEQTGQAQGSKTATVEGTAQEQPLPPAQDVETPEASRGPDGVLRNPDGSIVQNQAGLQPSEGVSDKPIAAQEQPLPPARDVEAPIPAPLDTPRQVADTSRPVGPESRTKINPDEIYKTGFVEFKHSPSVVEDGDVVEPESWKFSGSGDGKSSALVTKYSDGEYQLETDDGFGKTEATQFKEFDDARAAAEKYIQAEDANFLGVINQGAEIGPLLNTLDLPPSFKIDSFYKANGGSIYFNLIDNEGNPLKLSIRDHEPSPFREKEFGAVDRFEEVKNTGDLKEVGDAMTRLEDWLYKKSGGQSALLSRGARSAFASKPTLSAKRQNETTTREGGQSKKVSENPTAEQAPVEQAASPVPADNIYMRMPIERVRSDAAAGVGLAKEALAIREPKAEKPKEKALPPADQRSREVSDENEPEYIQLPEKDGSGVAGVPDAPPPVRKSRVRTAAQRRNDAELKRKSAPVDQALADFRAAHPYIRRPADNDSVWTELMGISAKEPGAVPRRRFKDDPALSSWDQVLDEARQKIPHIISEDDYGQPSALAKIYTGRLETVGQSEARERKEWDNRAEAEISAQFEAQFMLYIEDATLPPALMREQHPEAWTRALERAEADESALINMEAEVAADEIVKAEEYKPEKPAAGEVIKAVDPKTGQEDRTSVGVSGKRPSQDQIADALIGRGLMRELDRGKKQYAYSIAKVIPAAKWLQINDIILLYGRGKRPGGEVENAIIRKIRDYIDAGLMTTMYRADGMPVHAWSGTAPADGLLTVDEIRVIEEKAKGKPSAIKGIAQSGQTELIGQDEGGLKLVGEAVKQKPAAMDLGPEMFKGSETRGRALDDLDAKGLADLKKVAVRENVGLMRGGVDLSKLGADKVREAIREAWKQGAGVKKQMPGGATTSKIKWNALKTMKRPELRALAAENSISTGGSNQELRDRLAEKLGLEKDMIRERLERAGRMTDTNPTEAMKEAENYAVGRLRYRGHVISIENPVGSIRRGVSRDGTEWAQKMKNTYGRILGTTAADGDNLDVFFNDASPVSDRVFIVNQVDPETGRFDEEKVMLGFDTPEAAKAAYLSNYEKGWQGLGSLDEMSWNAFSDLIRDVDDYARHLDAKKATKGVSEVSNESSAVQNLGAGKGSRRGGYAPGQGPVVSDGRGAGIDAGGSREAVGADGDSGQSDSGLPHRSDALHGKRGDQPGRLETPESGTAPGVAGDGESQRGGLSGGAGVQPDAGAVGDFNGNSAASERADTEGQRGTRGVGQSAAAALQQRVKQQQSAEKIEAKAGDPQNIRETLPVLFTEQHDDVFHAENRILVEDKHGVLFTNGTGTGKTFTGLGVIKRFQKMGRGEILIVTPTDKKNQDWKQDAALLGIEANILAGTTDGGRGVTITTYANFYQNRALAQRDFDLVVYDESHKLDASQNQGSTVYSLRHKAVTKHPKYIWELARERSPKWYALEQRFEKLASQVEQKHFGKDVPNPDSLLEQAYNLAYPDLGEIFDGPKNERAGKLRRLLGGRLTGEKGPLAADSEAARTEIRQLEDQLRAAPRGKALFLSASPFAYHVSVDYAEGYLFDYEEVSNPGYNVATGLDKFLQDNLGYQMRTGKLNRPDAEVNVDLLERKLFEEWKKTGAVRGRQLKVGVDYSRHFVDVSVSKQGVMLNNAFATLYSGFDNGFSQLRTFAGKNYTFHYINYMLESMKAAEAVERARKHIALGRKVVLFHGYKKPTTAFTENPAPFRFVKADETKGNWKEREDARKWNAEVDRFYEAMPGLKNFRWNFKNPLDLFMQEFGADAVVVNGDVPKGKRLKNMDDFNRADGPKVIIVQIDAGREGISLHDTAGDTPRALINISLPYKPMDVIQSEGRIYRLGSESNAVYEYLKLGLNFEQVAFNQKISTRSRTAENLAMGNLARDMEQVLKDGYLNSTAEDPHTGQGLGGKEMDQRVESGEISGFEYAKTFYWAKQKRTSKTKAQEGADYFATPEPVGFKMVEWAGIRDGSRVLEPSAGDGAIGRWFPENTQNTFIEPSYELMTKLQTNVSGSHNRFETDNFEDLYIRNKYDAVVMNPPFGAGGKTAVEHLAKAFDHLKPGGRLVALIPEGPSADKRFDAWMESKDAKEAYTAGIIHLPNVTFERAGTQVKTRIVIIDRQPNPADAHQTRELSFENAADTKELFDRIEEVGFDRPNEPTPVEKHETGKLKSETKDLARGLTSSRDFVLPDRSADDVLNVGDVITITERHPVLPDLEAGRSYGIDSINGNDVRLVNTFTRAASVEKLSYLKRYGKFTKEGEQRFSVSETPERAKYRAVEPVTLTGDEVSVPPMQYRRAAEWAAANGQTGTFKNAETGWDVIVTKNRIVRALHRGAARDKVKMLAGVRSMIERAVYLESDADYKPKAISHFFAVPVQVDGKEYAVGFVIHEDIQTKKRYYTHELVEEKDLKGAVPEYGQNAEAPRGHIGKVLQKHLGVNPDDVQRFSVQDNIGFYSALERAVEGFKQETFTADQLAGMVKNAQGVKAEELDDIGFNDWLSGIEGKVTKEQALEFIRNNGPQIQETIKDRRARTSARRQIEERVRELSRLENEISPTDEMSRVAYKINDHLRPIDTVPEYSDLAGSEYPEVAPFAVNDRVKILKLVSIYKERSELIDRLNEASEAGEMGLGDKFGGPNTTLPGGENYREVLLTLPVVKDIPVPTYEQWVELKEMRDDVRLDFLGTEDVVEVDTSRNAYEREVGNMRPLASSVYKSSHWDEPNVLAHVRMNDRTGPNGEKILFIEEIQSDWHQAGRKKGYRGNDLPYGWEVREAPGTAVRLGNVWAVYDESNRVVSQAATKEAAIQYAVAGRKGVPDAPFKKSWSMLAFKRVLRMAAEQGYDSVAWTPGDVQAERYDLSKQVEDIQVQPKADGERSIKLHPVSGNEIVFTVDATGNVMRGWTGGAQEFVGKPLDEVVGKEVAEKIMAMEAAGTLEGESLKVGGEGMKGFYDKILPKEIQKYVGKMGGKVGTADIATEKKKEIYYVLLPGAGRADGMEFDNHTEAYEHLKSLRAAEEGATGDYRDLRVEKGFAFKMQPSDSRVWNLPITDQMRAQVMAGQPRFAVAGVNAATAGKTETAEQLEGAGADRMTIWKETGWWRGPDGKWRFEVDDSKLVLKDYLDVLDEYYAFNPSGRSGARSFGVPAEALIEHPDLFRAYPQLRGLRLKDMGNERVGMFTSAGISPIGTIEYGGATPSEKAEVVMHEIQHAIQHREGFTNGGNPNNADPRLAQSFYEDRLKKYTERYQRANEAVRANLTQATMDEFNKASEQLTALSNSPRLFDYFKAYQLIPGEVESRMVERRLNMEPWQRKAEAPWQTMETMLREEGLLSDDQKPEDIFGAQSGLRNAAATDKEMSYGTEAGYDTGRDPRGLRRDGGPGLGERAEGESGERAGRSASDNQGAAGRGVQQYDSPLGTEARRRVDSEKSRRNALPAGAQRALDQRVVDDLNTFEPDYERIEADGLLEKAPMGQLIVPVKTKEINAFVSFDGKTIFVSTSKLDPEMTYEQARDHEIAHTLENATGSAADAVRFLAEQVDKNSPEFSAYYAVLSRRLSPAYANKWTASEIAADFTAGVKTRYGIELSRAFGANLKKAQNTAGTLRIALRQAVGSRKGFAGLQTLENRGQSVPTNRDGRFSVSPSASDKLAAVGLLTKAFEGRAGKYNAPSPALLKRRMKKLEAAMQGPQAGRAEALSEFSRLSLPENMRWRLKGTLTRLANDPKVGMDEFWRAAMNKTRALLDESSVLRADPKATIEAGNIKSPRQAAMVQGIKEMIARNEEEAKPVTEALTAEFEGAQITDPVLKQYVRDLNQGIRKSRTKATIRLVEDGKKAKISGFWDVERAFETLQEQTGIPFWNIYRRIFFLDRDIDFETKQQVEDIFDGLKNNSGKPAKVEDIIYNPESQQRIIRYLDTGLVDQGITDFELNVGDRVKALYKQWEPFVKMHAHLQWIRSGVMPGKGTPKMMQEGADIRAKYGDDSKEYTAWINKQDFGVRTFYSPKVHESAPQVMQDKKRVFGQGFMKRRKGPGESKSLIGGLYSYIRNARRVSDLEPHLKKLEALFNENHKTVDAGIVDRFFNNLYGNRIKLDAWQKMVLSGTGRFFRVRIPQAVLRWSLRNKFQPTTNVIPRVFSPFDPIFWKNLRHVWSPLSGAKVGTVQHYINKKVKADEQLAVYFHRYISSLDASRTEKFLLEMNKYEEIANLGQGFMHMMDTIGKGYTWSDIDNRAQTFIYGIEAGIEALERYREKPTSANWNAFLNLTGMQLAPKTEQIELANLVDQGRDTDAVYLAAHRLADATQFRYVRSERGLGWQEPGKGMHTGMPIATYWKGTAQMLHDDLSAVNDFIKTPNKQSARRAWKGLANLAIWYLISLVVNKIYEELYDVDSGAYGLKTLMYVPGGPVVTHLIETADALAAVWGDERGWDYKLALVTHSAADFYVPLYHIANKALTPSYAVENGNRMTQLGFKLPMEARRILKEKIAEISGAETPVDRRRWVELAAGQQIQRILLDGASATSRQKLQDLYGKWMDAEDEGYPDDIQAASKELDAAFRKYPLSTTKSFRKKTTDLEPVVRDIRRIDKAIPGIRDDYRTEKKMEINLQKR